jgi:hypothetical protein
MRGRERIPKIILAILHIGHMPASHRFSVNERRDGYARREHPKKYSGTSRYVRNWERDLVEMFFKERRRSKEPKMLTDLLQ